MLFIVGIIIGLYYTFSDISTCYNENRFHGGRFNDRGFNTTRIAELCDMRPNNIVCEVCEFGHPYTIEFRFMTLCKGFFQPGCGKVQSFILSFC